MDEDIAKGKWHELKVSAKEQWGRLTEEDLDKVEVSVELLVSVIQARYGYTKVRARKEISEWAKKCEC